MFIELKNLFLIEIINLMNIFFNKEEADNIKENICILLFLI